MARAEVRINLRELDDAIFDGIADNKELRRAFDDLVDDVHATWVSLAPDGSATRGSTVRQRYMEYQERRNSTDDHPYATGDYVRSIKKRKMSKWYRGHVRNFLRRFGVPIGMVYSDSPRAHLIEYGSGPDNGGDSPWGPNTSTPIYAPMRKTYARFLAK